MHILEAALAANLQKPADWQSDQAPQAGQRLFARAGRGLLSLLMATLDSAETAKRPEPDQPPKRSVTLAAGGVTVTSR